MNYAAHYERMMVRARGRALVGYRERHHVVPRCMGGTNASANMVELTPEEHYVAHQLLVRMHPERPGLAYAAMKMAKKATGRRAYGWLRARFSIFVSALHSGVPHSAEHKAKIGAKSRGRKFCPEVRAKASAWQRGRTLTPEHRANIAAGLKGKKREPGRRLTYEHKAKISRSLLGNRRTVGRPLSAEHRAKISAGLVRRGQAVQ